MGIVGVLVLYRQQLWVINGRIKCYGVQSIQVPILWKQSEGVNVDANIEVVPVVSKQPLKCMMYYTPPDTKVTMCVGRSFFLNHNDVKLTGQSRQGVGEGGYGRLITACPL